VKDNAYAVTLDGKTVKTPGRNQLELPTRSMAFAVASEWDAQKHDIRPSTMPLMTLAATSIDLDPISGPKDLINEMIQYLHSDTICYQVTVDQQEKLAVIQQKKWDPIRKWFVEEFDGEVDVNHGSIHALRHDPAVVENVSKELKKV
jgi:ATP synthase F1 complex assembly factor 2